MVTQAGRRPYAPRLPLAARREQLLDAAQALALDLGFHAVTVEGVARAAGVTRPVVYGAFEDLADLLRALTDRAEARVVAQLTAVYPQVPGPHSGVDPDELLVEGVTAYLTAVRDNPADWSVTLLPPEGSPPEMQHRIHEHRRRLLAQLRALSDWGLQERARRDGGAVGLDADLFARAVFTLAEGAARLVLMDPERWRVEQFTAFTRASLGALRPVPSA